MLPLVDFIKYYQNNLSMKDISIPLLKAYIQKIQIFSERNRVKIIWGNDFSRFNKLYCNISKYKHIESVFNCSQQKILDENGIYVLAIDNKSNLIATNAARHFIWDDGHLDSMMPKLQSFYYEPDFGITDETKFTCNSFQQGKLVCGNNVYCGATWVKPEFRGFGFSSVLPRLNKVLAYLLWNANIYWGFIDENIYTNKLFLKYGMQNIFPVELSYYINDQLKKIHDYVAYIKKDEVIEELNKGIIL